MARLYDFYKDTVVPELMKQFGYKSIMQVPRIEKITVNMGVGEAVADKKVMDFAVGDLETGVGPVRAGYRHVDGKVRPEKDP